MTKRISKHERQNIAYAKAQERLWQAQWVAEGRTLADYKAGIDDMDSVVWDWRRSLGEAAVAAESAAWLRDHPGNPLPEHLCALDRAQYAEYETWRTRRYEKQLLAELGRGQGKKDRQFARLKYLRRQIQADFAP
jgi:hypothetical protein